ncbi:carbohydrate ABC transporter permease [Paenibacillus dokdonensis]|uniref:Carbohydrate ABC transporter permease n=1 Tax=Paenibacillus dokdonensis TaxID=2567944 RepID=A0ABU6GQ52_9BACL|nr:carbohydrate ABC transporter permease [Paenibacillus dokdonensis]MEC0241257.1 carbohydrate ABC transporter permease [Paenibacillus dokdonensis]
MEPSFLKPSLGSRVFDLCNVMIMLVLSFAMLYPFINLLALSLNDGADAARGGIYLLPRQFSLDSYMLLFQNKRLLSGLGISILRVVVGTTTCVFMTGLLAYIVTIRGFSGRKMLRLLFLFTMYFGGGLIPTYMLMMKLGLINTFHVYWIPGLLNAYYMLIMASYMQNLPESLSESARIDGAGELLIYFRIIFPVSLPVFASIAVFSSVGHWNAWFDVILYNSNGHWDTLQVYLRRLLLEVEALQQVADQQLAYSKFRNISPLTLRAATSMVVTVPIIFVYPFFQKYFVGGITLGAVKG